MEEIDSCGVPILYNSRFLPAMFRREMLKIDPAGFLSENGGETTRVSGEGAEIQIPKPGDPIDNMEP